MEHLQFEFKTPGNRPSGRASALVGVVSSGNLEVMVESTDLNEACQVEVNTSARGFAAIWQAVLTDFAERHDLAGLRISINDGGATPAVVSLRLDQAIEEFLGMSS
jgi:malonate decarboxylase delta subunit